MTYDEAKAEVFVEMDRTWPNLCLICGERPVFRIERNFDWMVRCPNWQDKNHCECVNVPHSVYCRNRDEARNTWNGDHPNAARLEWLKAAQNKRPVLPGTKFLIFRTLQEK